MSVMALDSESCYGILIDPSNMQYLYDNSQCYVFSQLEKMFEKLCETHSVAVCT